MGKQRLSQRAIRRNRLRDIFLIGMSIYAAIALEQTGAISAWIASSSDYSVLASFIGGFFFTSLFTTVPSIVALGELSLHNPILAVAIPGAFGAVLGDLLLFTFVRETISEDFKGVISGSWQKAMRGAMSRPYLHWLMPIIGAIIIASPLPDELGIAMLGLTKARLSFVIPVSLLMNFLGIVAIGLAVQAL